MDKQILLAAILSQIENLHLPYIVAKNGDIFLDSEFYYLNQRFQHKKIKYEALIFVEESSLMVYMWKEITQRNIYKSGPKKGQEYEKNRKMCFGQTKRMRYGVDGKIYEETFRLNTIQQTIRATVKGKGWKFKKLLNKKLLWPFQWNGKKNTNSMLN